MVLRRNWNRLLYRIRRHRLSQISGRTGPVALFGKRNLRRTIWPTFPPIVLTILFAGCASFPAKDIPSVSYNQLDRESLKLAIEYDIAEGDKAFNLDKICGEEVEKVFRQSDIFSEFHPGTGITDYHFSISCRNGYENFGGRMIVAIASGFLSGSTLMILPGYATDTFVLSVDVKKENQVLKHYEYHDSMNTWIELFLIFWMSVHSPVQVRAEIIDNMLLNFLHDLQRDKIVTIHS